MKDGFFYILSDSKLLAEIGRKLGNYRTALIGLCVVNVLLTVMLCAQAERLDALEARLDHGESAQ